MIKFPYAIREFEKIIDGEYLYLDRTHHIRFIEKWGYELLLLRPRRFGKSLWLSTLMHYYDIAKADEFERLFGHLAIGEEPTPLRNSYMVMRWDFSKVAVSGEIEDIQRSLNGHLNSRIERFYQIYKDLLSIPIQIHPDAFASLESLTTAVAISGHKLYLFIDEYDNFANEVLMVPKQRTKQQGEEHRQRYIDLVKGEGIFKTLFKNLKSAGSGDGLDRLFMTGVSPIVLSDVTSGANTFKNISWHPALNTLCGFTQAELRGLVTQLLSSPEMQQEMQERGIAAEAEIEPMMKLMQNYYNGSLFVDDFYKFDMDNLPKVYNPTLTFYFLEEFQSRGYYPKELLDGNLAPDDHKLMHIAAYEQGPTLLDDAFAQDRTITVRTLRKKFGVQDLLDHELQSDHLAVLLYYLGALTSVGETKSGHTVLEIPNLVIQKFYSERVLSQKVESDNAKVQKGMAVADILFETGELEPLCTFAQEHLLSLYKGRDAKDFNEGTLKTIFMMLLYHTNIYLIYSEAEIERRFGDLLMLVRPGMRHYGLYDVLFEFKRLPLHKTTEEVPTKKGTTTRKALTGEEAKTRSREALMALDAVIEKFDEARNQLRDYRRKLMKIHEGGLNLRCYAVVSVGFDRILWEEVLD